MKANNGSGNNASRDEWETPQELFNNLNKQYNFSVDCCAKEKNKKCQWYPYNFLSLEKIGTCWMNPPFSKAKEMFEHFFKIVKEGVAIYRCDNLETIIWQDLILQKADWVFIPKGRVCYEGMKGKGSRFPSALIGVGVEPPKHVDGVCLKLQ